MSNVSQNVATVNFKGDTLITLEKDGEHYVAVRPIVENMGLDWKRQSEKLNRTPKFGCVHMNTPTSGGTQKMLCIPVRKLNGWLFSINPEKVRSDIRHIVEQYQEECFTVLHDYWHKGVAVNERANVSVMPTTLAQMTPLPKQIFRETGSDSRFHSALHNMISQVANCYLDSQRAFNHIDRQLAYVCGVDCTGHIGYERLPTALQALSFMAREATQHQKMIEQVDNNGLLALSVKTSVAQGFLE